MNTRSCRSRQAERFMLVSVDALLVARRHQWLNSSHPLGDVQLANVSTPGAGTRHRELCGAARPFSDVGAGLGSLTGRSWGLTLSHSCAMVCNVRRSCQACCGSFNLYWAVRPLPS